MTQTGNAPFTYVSDGPWLVWMWRYGSLDVEGHASREEAIDMALAVEDNGDGSLHCVEGPDGLVPQADINAIERARSEERMAEMRSQPKNTHRLDLAAPDGRKSAPVGFYTSEGEAREAQALLLPRYGDRLSVHPLPSR